VAPSPPTCSLDVRTMERQSGHVRSRCIHSATQSSQKMCPHASRTGLPPAALSAAPHAARRTPHAAAAAAAPATAAECTLRAAERLGDRAGGRHPRSASQQMVQVTAAASSSASPACSAASASVA
jgi:hypothetical protein